MCNQSNTERLAKLREELEEGATEIHNLEVPALLLLEDVCRALRLSDEERRQVLGQRAAQRVEAWSFETVEVTETRVPR